LCLLKRVGDGIDAADAQGSALSLGHCGATTVAEIALARHFASAAIAVQVAVVSALTAGLFPDRTGIDDVEPLSGHSIFVMHTRNVWHCFS